ncbi:hypothetical protein [Pseudoxanthomonas sp. UTMC 1351]|uniref:hypothetical protein n=1 Tax=Pseudoxanthomonas sp. UTMC 1351 TaxID=2695853 RepID=UPI0034D010DB
MWPPKDRQNFYRLDWLCSVQDPLQVMRPSSTFKQYRFKPDQRELVDFDRNTRFAANAEPMPADAMVEFAAFHRAALQQDA